MRSFCLSFWGTTRYLTYRRTILDVTAPCLYAVWFLISMAYYADFTPACYEPYPSYGLFLFTIMMVLIIPSAFFVICLVSFLLVFCPCIVYTVGKAYFDQR